MDYKVEDMTHVSQSLNKKLIIAYVGQVINFMYSTYEPKYAFNIHPQKIQS